MRFRRLIPFAIICAYATAALYELPLVRYQINPDGIAYIHAARRWATGNFLGAINGCYSPLFSWLLVPFIRSGLDALLASKIITFAAGALGVIVFWRLSGHFSERLTLRAIGTIAAAAMLLSWAATFVTPDVLVVVAFSAWLLFLLEEPTTANAIAAGVAGGLMYLTKSYGFPFVVASLGAGTVIALWSAGILPAGVHASIVHAAAGSRRTGRLEGGAPLKAAAITLAIFLIIAIPWAAAISSKYHRPTIGTAAAYNIGLIGPANGAVGSRNHAIRTRGLMPPSDPQAFSASDDLTYHPFPPWPGGIANVKRIWLNVAFNMGELWENIGGASFIAGLVAIVGFRFLGDRKRNVLLAMITAAVYLGGYVLMILEQRYLWPVRIALLLVAIALVDRTTVKLKLGRFSEAVVALAVVACFAWPALAKLPELKNIDVELLDDVRQLQMHGIDLRGHRVASLNDWDSSMYLLYYLDAIYYGAPGENQPEAAFRKQLDQYRIDTVLVWGDDADQPQPLLDGWRKVAVLDQGPVAIYQREPASNSRISL